MQKKHVRDMSESGEQIGYYLAQRVADMPKPPISATKRKCSKCGLDVWVSNKTLEKADKLKLICPQCFTTLKRDDITLDILPETIEEVYELIIREEMKIKQRGYYH